MRKWMLTVALAGMVALPVLAQRFGGGLDGSMLLSDENVQKALKLSDDQKSAIKKASDARQEAFKKAREDKDREAFRKGMEDFGKAMAAVRKDLKPDQVVRLTGIEAQLAEQTGRPQIFANPHVEKALKLSDKQKESIKGLVSDFEKEAKELREDAGNDFRKMGEARRKIATKGKEILGKITKQLSDDQKKAFTEFQGEKVEVNFGFGPGKEKPRKKKGDI